jgi:hypothetical protein
MVDTQEDFDTWRKEKKVRSQSPRAIIIALKPDIKALIEAGHSRKSIWRYFTDREKLTCTYETFLRNVKTHILDESSLVKDGKEKTGKNEALKNFTQFDPTPNEKDLIG